MERTHSRYSRGLARIISRVFDPFVVMVPLMYVAVAQSTLAIRDRQTFLVIFWTGMVLPPVLLLVIAIQRRLISDWDVGNRKERVPALAVLLALSILDIYLVAHFGDAFLMQLFLMFIAWLAGFFLITTQWKISGHTGIATLASGLLTLWIGGAAWFLFLIPPVVAWARVVGKNHTLAQAAAGILYSLVFLGVYAGVVSL